MRVIETERLILRLHTIEDVEASYQMNLDENVSAFTGDGGVVSHEEIERRIREDVLGDYEKHGFGRFAVVEKSSGEFIGFAGLKYLEDLDEVDLGYRFIFSKWGKGYATEASKACVDFGFNELNLKKIIAFVLPDNIGSVRVLEKLGFEYEKDVVEDGLQARLYSLSAGRH